jgi:ABC-type phosphate/phosphonate transport system substrate-binding protein
MMGKTWRLAMPMYNVSPQVERAWEQLLKCLIAQLQALGWTETMEIVEPRQDLLEFWSSPDVLLAQTCGFPFVTQLIDKVRLIAVPAFDYPGCNGVNYLSYFVVKETSHFHTLESLRGHRAVINQPHSQSGMNALRHAIAPLAIEGCFFKSVHESGSHLASVDWVRRGNADLASIDCVTLGLLQRHAPKWVEGIRVVGASMPTPGLPMIASASITERQGNDLRSALNFLETSVPELLRFLGLNRFETVTQSAYTVISDQVAEARLKGYPILR